MRLSVVCVFLLLCVGVPAVWGLDACRQACPPGSCSQSACEAISSSCYYTADGECHDCSEVSTCEDYNRFGDTGVCGADRCGIGGCSFVAGQCCTDPDQDGVCTYRSVEGAEVCDGSDNNCDAQTDEGLVCAPKDVDLAPGEEPSQFSCQSGSCACQPNPLPPDQWDHYSGCMSCDFATQGVCSCQETLTDGCGNFYNVTHACPPIDCQVSGWSPPQSNYYCDQTFPQMRSIIVSPSCGGASCPSLSRTVSGTSDIQRTSWSPSNCCSPACGSSCTATQTSNWACSPTTRSQSCSRTGTTEVWGSWGPCGGCSPPCGGSCTGTQSRTSNCGNVQTRSCTVYGATEVWGGWSSCGGCAGGCRGCTGSRSRSSNCGNVQTQSCSVPAQYGCGPGTCCSTSTNTCFNYNDNFCLNYGTYGRYYRCGGQYVPQCGGSYMCSLLGQSDPKFFSSPYTNGCHIGHSCGRDIAGTGTACKA